MSIFIARPLTLLFGARSLVVCREWRMMCTAAKIATHLLLAESVEMNG